MFEFAFIIGFYSYVIFFLGILGLLYKNIIIAATTVYFLLVVIYFGKTHRIKFKSLNFKSTDKFSKFLLIILGIQIIVNFVGVLGPEISFDALWYHLTLPKIFLESHRIFHIPGNLLYYSDMPKNIEMLYLAALAFSNELLAKFIHFSFGILSLIAIYYLARKFLSRRLALLSCVIFYSNLVVGWQSIAAYVDLGRTFFEVVALYEFITWIKNKNIKYLVFSAVMTGFAVSAKLAALDSVFIFILLIILFSVESRLKILITLKNVLYFIFFSLLIPLPWFLFSFINTGNPFYPLLNQSFNIHSYLSLPDVIKLFLFSSDPISPVYLIFLPVIFLIFKKFKTELKYVSIYFLLALFFWYLTSEIGGSRFIMPYLPALSVVTAGTFAYLNNRLLKTYLIALIILVSLSSISYRFLANSKFIPVILGKESKAKFLSKNLNYSFGDFYDTDGYFSSHIKKTDTILLFGFHNLYYADFPFIDSSWVKKGDKFNYIAVQSANLPAKFSNWKEIYYNGLTNVKLYSLGGKMWVY